MFSIFFIANAVALYTGRIACLHLFPHNPILVAELVVRTVVKFILQKTCHLILIEIHLAGVAFILLIIHKIAARLTACGHLAGVLFLLCMGCWFYHMAIPPISYTSLFRFGASGRGRISIFHPQPGKCRTSGNRTHPPPTELGDPEPGCGILPDGDVCGRCEPPG